MGFISAGDGFIFPRAHTYSASPFTWRLEVMSFERGDAAAAMRGLILELLTLSIDSRGGRGDSSPSRRAYRASKKCAALLTSARFGL